MSHLATHDQCCGCGACLQACCHNAITFSHDAEGFERPDVDAGKCTECGLCELACPVLHLREPSSPLAVQGVIHDSDAVRLASSSGGVFHAIATEVLKQGGIVVGAAFDEHHVLRHTSIDTPEGLASLRGSKYIQSSNHDAYLRVREALRAGRRTLFVGTPCMVAGLHRFLRQRHPLLLTADFFCHGVPSPGLWQRFIEELLTSRHLRHEDITAISFRDKSHGWRRYSLALTLKTGQRITVNRRRNAFQQAFDENLSLRPSCHECLFRSGRSGSDITLADFWDVAHVRPDIDDDRGTSLVLCNTDAGIEAIDLPSLRCFDTDLEVATRHNPAYKATRTTPHARREAFFDRLRTTNEATTSIKEALRLPLSQRLRKELNVRVYILKQHIMRLCTWK